MNPLRANCLPTVIMVALGWAALVWTTVAIVRTALFLHRTIHVTGTIFDPQPHPLIHFETRDGVTITFRQNGFVSRPRGASVPVAYDPADPAGTARAATFWTTWGIALWMLPFGVTFGLFPWLRDRLGLTIERR